MKFGSFYELEIPRPWEPGKEQRIFREGLEQVELADRLGFDSVWATEHHFLEEYAHSSAPEVFLAACSQRTKHIRLGHGVTLLPLAYNHPARVAERIATLDLVSEGRVEFGTGESSSEVELGGFGIRRQDKREMWQESLEAICRMFAEEPFMGHKGKYFEMPPRNVVPKPVQKPHPPLWVACSKAETIQLAARNGIGALSFAFVPLTQIKPWVDGYYKTLEEESLPVGAAINPNIVFTIQFMCLKNGDRAREIANEAHRFFSYAISHYYVFGEHQPGKTNLWHNFKTDKEHVGQQVWGGSTQVVGEGVKPTDCVGTPKQVREVLLQYERLGADQVVFITQTANTPHEVLCEALELFGREVMPEFQEREAKREKEKAARLEPILEKAMKRKAVPKIPRRDGPTIVKAAGGLL
jgi:alkanesulfonate monooxygenase SsuD/methylene tetrahydromethanopterin reductase-like flavin-dependent oxidoreductase (luciferase family)